MFYFLNFRIKFSLNKIIKKYLKYYLIMPYFSKKIRHFYGNIKNHFMNNYT